MPTPSDTTIPASPFSTLSPRSTLSICPPEENRAATAQQLSERRFTDILDGIAADAENDCDEHTITQQPTPEPEDHSGTTRDGREDGETDIPKEIERVEDISLSSDIPSSAASPASAILIENETSQEEEDLCAARYLELPGRRVRHTMNTTSSFLRSGSRFHGTQRSDRQVYNVQVEIKDVNLEDSFLCGYLRIQGLTDDHPTLTTFFEGEIIGQKHRFKTTHASWGVTEKTDLQHWAKFPPWRPMAKSARASNYYIKDFSQQEHLFMRWKEYFLVPDHRVKTITGASFEGFYYICFNQCDGRVSGIYFHSKSEKYQRLELQHVEDHGCIGAVEMR